MTGPIVRRPDGILLRVRAQPRASRDEIVGLQGDRLKIRLSAPPVEGAANAACRDLLADRLGVPRAAVRLVSGERSRDKTFEILGSPDRLEEILASHFG